MSVIDVLSVLGMLYLAVGFLTGIVHCSMLKTFNPECRTVRVIVTLLLILVGWPVYLAALPTMIGNAVNTERCQHLSDIERKDALLDDIMHQLMNTEVELSKKQEQLKKAEKDLRRADAWLQIKDYNLKLTEQMLTDFAVAINATDLMTVPMEIMGSKE